MKKKRLNITKSFKDFVYSTTGKGKSHLLFVKHCGKGLLRLENFKLFCSLIKITLKILGKVIINLAVNSTFCPE